MHSESLHCSNIVVDVDDDVDDDVDVDVDVDELVVDVISATHVSVHVPFIEQILDGLHSQLPEILQQQ